MLVLILLIVNTGLINSSNVDFNKVFTQYATACGLKFCNISSIRLPYFDESLTRHHSVCPPCACQDCILNINCCPEIGLYLNDFKCTSDVIYSPYQDESGFHFAIKDSCPDNTDSELRTLCKNTTTLAEKLTLTPVTGRSGVTYRNNYCAQCNEESDFHTWTFDIKCKEFVDFNFLSSFDEIVDMIKLKSCTVKYVMSNLNYTIQRCEPERNDLIGKCNITGTWQSYDYNIEWACYNFELPFDNYKNVFCLMCNPPTPNTTVIRECGQRQEPKADDIALENACKLFSFNEITYPFKNIFCYQCNKINNNNKYIDIDGEFIAVMNAYDQRVTYTMSGSKFTTEFLANYLVSSNDKPMMNANSMTRLNSSFVFYDSEREVNITHLLAQYTYRYGPEICGTYNLGSKSQGPAPLFCSCSQDCLISKTCCIDFEFDQRQSCINGRVITNICRYADEGLNSYCFKRGGLIFDVPVSWFGKSYANVFCALCADDYVNHESLHPVLCGQLFSPLNSQITCPLSNTLSVHFRLSLKDIVDEANKINCNITFQPNEWDNCDDTSNTINTCNISGTWDKQDDDVLWACEKLNDTYLSSYMGYRNVFCTLCNPYLPMPGPITTSAPERTTSTSSRYCPFCISSGNVISFRSLFKLTEQTEISINYCKGDEILDKIQNKCRKVRCSPGYILVNTSCEPLLKITSKLGYILPVRIETFSPINPTFQIYFLQRIHISLQPFLQRFLGLSNGSIHPQISVVHMVTNITCSRNESMWTEILATIEIFIGENVDRKEIETKLVKLKGEIVYTDYKANDTRLKISLFQDAMDTKNIINNEAQFSGKCYLSDLNLQRSHAYYRFTPVSELMICRQVHLIKQEIDIDKSTSTLKIKGTNAMLRKWKYRLQPNDSVRICVEELEKLKKPYQKSDPVLQNIMIITSAASMICMSITFITYCIFPNLRSVPGKNNMSIVFSLFMFQSIFTFAGNKTEHDIGCICIGIVLHFFLLSTFACLSVCTFHMLRTFKSINVRHTDEHDNKTILVYSLYAYCTPAIVIAINSSVTMAIKGDVGYGNRGNICFLLHSYSIIGSLIVPASVICLCNVIFFVVTIHEISSVPKVERTNSHTSVQMNIVVYIKLFSLTGITWILQIVDSFLPMTYLSIFVSILNALQGVYIFMSYTYNERVMKMYKQLCGCHTSNAESSATKLTTYQITKVPGVDVSHATNMTKNEH